MTENRATCEEKLNDKRVYDPWNCVRCWLHCFVNFVTLNTAFHLWKFTSPAPSISKHEHAGSCIVPTHTRFLPFGLERKPMSMLCRMTSIVHLSHNARIISFSSELSKNRPLLLDNGYLVQLILQVCMWFWQFIRRFFTSTFPVLSDRTSVFPVTRRIECCLRKVRARYDKINEVNQERNKMTIVRRILSTIGLLSKTQRICIYYLSD